LDGVSILKSVARIFLAAISQVLANYTQKPGHYAMLLCFQLVAIMLWVRYYYAPLTGYYSWNSVRN